MKEFFRKNAFQIIIGICGLIGMAYVLNANVSSLVKDNEKNKADIAELKTKSALREQEGNYILQRLDGMDRKLDRLLRR